MPARIKRLLRSVGDGCVDSETALKKTEREEGTNERAKIREETTEYAGECHPRDSQANPATGYHFLRGGTTGP